MSPWTIAVTSGDAAPFHNRPDPVAPDPAVWIHHITRPALVLGSSQATDVVDRRRAERDGVEVCRRRTGGGLVLLEPGRHCWIDVVIPTTSDHWNADVGRAFHWLGTAWAHTLERLLNHDRTPASRIHEARIEVHRGPLERRQEGRVICFAGLGPGEVTVGGAKVIGISQRRWRSGARFQCAAIWRWDPANLSRYLSPEALEAAGMTDLSGLRVGLDADARRRPGDLGSQAVADAFLAELPDP